MRSLFRFRTDDDVGFISLTSEEIIAAAAAPPAPSSLLDRSHAVVAASLDRFRGDEVRLEAEIDALNEELRQTRVALEAFASAERLLAEGRQSGEIAS